MYLQEKSNPTNNQIIDVLKSDLKKIQNEKNDLTDEVVLLQHRLSIQTRKVDECMHELTSLRSHQTDAPKENHEPNDAVEIKRLMSEKDKLAGELSDLKNINEELQHQHETSLEMYIMKVQELEEVRFLKHISMKIEFVRIYADFCFHNIRELKKYDGIRFSSTV